MQHKIMRRTVSGDFGTIDYELEIKRVKNINLRICRDGAVRVSDAVLIMRYALGLIEFTPEQILCGDVDGDGFVKVADAVMVIRIALGLA